MIISDLEHLEVVREENTVEGGYANAYAYSYTSASGNNVAITRSIAYTGTISASSYLSYYSPGTFPYRYYPY